jgi:hypothetical protein
MRQSFASRLVGEYRSRGHPLPVFTIGDGQRVAYTLIFSREYKEYVTIETIDTTLWPEQLSELCFMLNR